MLSTRLAQIDLILILNTKIVKYNFNSMKVLLNITLIPEISRDFFVNSYENIGHFSNRFSLIYLLYILTKRSNNLKRSTISKNHVWVRVIMLDLCGMCCKSIMNDWEDWIVVIELAKWISNLTKERLLNKLMLTNHISYYNRYIYYLIIYYTLKGLLFI